MCSRRWKQALFEEAEAARLSEVNAIRSGVDLDGCIGADCAVTDRDPIQDTVGVQVAGRRVDHEDPRASGIRFGIRHAGRESVHVDAIRCGVDGDIPGRSSA